MLVLRLAPIMDWIARTIKHAKYLAKALNEINLTHLIIRLYLAIDLPYCTFCRDRGMPISQSIWLAWCNIYNDITICIGLPGLY